MKVLDGLIWTLWLGEAKLEAVLNDCGGGDVDGAALAEGGLKFCMGGQSDSNSGSTSSLHRCGLHDTILPVFLPKYPQIRIRDMLYIISRQIERLRLNHECPSEYLHPE